MLEIQSLSKSFEDTLVIANCSFRVETGQSMSVLGRSGCGKTTLLKMLAGLIAPDAGKVLIDGKDITGTPAHLRHMVYLPQEALLFPHLDVCENIAFGLRVRKKSNRVIQDEVRRMLEQLGLSDKLRSRPYELSGGERRRVSFGRSLITQPAVLLLDEPFENLDPETRTDMQKLYRKLSADYHITSVFVTHNLKEAIVMGDHISTLKNGQLHTYNDVHSFISDPASGASDEMAFWNQFSEKNTLDNQKSPEYLK
ncbi:MAG TPA: ABC transporter ATP-binding protein [Balneolales bacterium]|nr:ABC transporter ATP-binding protein [Balneolales bacterium]